MAEYVRQWKHSTHPANAKLDDHHFAGTVPTYAEVIEAWLETRCFDGRTMYSGRWPKLDEAVDARIAELEARPTLDAVEAAVRNVLFAPDAHGVVCWSDGTERKVGSILAELKGDE